VADVKRYCYNFRGDHVLYIGNSENRLVQNNRGAYPHIVKHLDELRGFITSSNAPYGIHRTRERRYFTADKLLCPNMFALPRFVFCSGEYYVNFSFNVVIATESNYSLKFVLGFLNSRAGALWFDCHAKKRGVNNDVGVAVMRAFPIPKVDSADSDSRSQHDRMVGLVETMLKLHKDLPKAKTPHEAEALQRQIAATDRQIDTLVYELYGLTEDEIRIVEGAP
jgi:hypothetical protein